MAVVLIPSWESHGLGLGTFIRISWPWSWCLHENLVDLVSIPSWESRGLDLDTFMRISWTWYRHADLVSYFLRLYNIMQIRLSHQFQLPLETCRCPRVVSYRIARPVSFILISLYYSCYWWRRCRPAVCSRWRM